MNQYSKKEEDSELRGLIMKSIMTGVDTYSIAKRWQEAMMGLPWPRAKPNGLVHAYKAFLCGMREIMRDYGVSAVEVGSECYSDGRPDDPILWTLTGFHIGKVEKKVGGEENFREAIFRDYEPSLYEPNKIVCNFLSELIKTAEYYNKVIDEFGAPLRLLESMSDNKYDTDIDRLERYL